MRVLDLTGRAADQFPDAEIFYEGDLLHEPEGFSVDVIVTRHLISAAGPMDDALGPLVERLAPGGEIHLLEPSAEWAAREIIANRADVPLYMHLYGEDGSRLKSIYTLITLREMLMRVGLLVGVAVTRPYVIAATEAGQEFKGDQHYLVGIKPSSEGAQKQWLP